MGGKTHRIQRPGDRRRSIEHADLKADAQGGREAQAQKLADSMEELPYVAKRCRIAPFNRKVKDARQIYPGKDGGKSRAANPECRHSPGAEDEQPVSEHVDTG